MENQDDFDGDLNNVKAGGGFRGFEVPKSNYFKMPNGWTDITSKIDSLSELKVVEYVLRHTWGFQEFGVMKRITIDEFMNGRLKKNGSRMDMGTGLSRSGVKDGIKRAIEDGYIQVEIDDSDKARVKQFFRLNMDDTDPDEKDDSIRVVKTTSQGVESQQLSSQNYQSRGHDSTLGGHDSTLDPKKETLERNKEELPTATAHTKGSSLIDDEGKILIDEEKPKEKPFIREAAELLHRHLAEKRKLMRPPSLSKWTEEFRQFFLTADIEKERFEKVLRWYVEHMNDDEFIPSARSAASFCEKFIQIEDQMEKRSKTKAEEEYVDYTPKGRIATPEEIEAMDAKRKKEEDEFYENLHREQDAQRIKLNGFFKKKETVH